MTERRPQPVNPCSEFGVVPTPQARHVSKVTALYWNTLANPAEVVSKSAGLQWNVRRLLARLADLRWNTLVSPPPPEGEQAVAAASFTDSVGINTHWRFADGPYYTQYPTARDLLVELGVKNIRDEGFYGTSTGAFGDTIATRYAEINGLGIDLNLLVSPTEPAFDLAAVTAEKLDWMDNRFGGVRSWEGPNEVDLTMTGDWATTGKDYQLSLYQAKQASTSQRPVVGLSVSDSNNATQLANIGDRMDYGNTHHYPLGWHPGYVEGEGVQNADRTYEWGIQAAALTMAPGEPHFMTETGWHAASNNGSDPMAWWPHTPEDVTAKYVPRVFLRNFILGVTRTFLYQLLDYIDNPGLTNPEAHFALVRFNLTRKPAFWSLKNLLAILADAGSVPSPALLAYEITGAPADMETLLLEHSGGHFFLVLWKEAASWNADTKTTITLPTHSITVDFPAAKSSVERFELSTSADSATAAQSWSDVTSVPLTLTDMPTILKITN